MNTHFQQDNKHLVTHKEMATLKGEPWDATRYATLDYILIPGRWNNCITKAWPSREIQTDSDHFILRATLRCKLAAKNKGNQTRETFFTPDTKQKQNYNETINEMKPQTAGQFIEAIMTASSQNLTRQDPAIRKSYISERTWELIKQKRDAREAGDYASELSLRKEAKKQPGKTSLRSTTSNLENCKELRREERLEV